MRLLRYRGWLLEWLGCCLVRVLKKMAPVFLACRLLLSCLLVWLSVLSLNCCTLLIYDRQALLDIRNSVTFTNSYTSDVDCSFDNTNESFRMVIPDCIRRWPLNIPRRKRRRKRGNRGGYIVKLKAHLRAGFLSDPSYESLYGGSATWRWLRPVLPCTRVLFLVPVSTELASALDDGE